MCDTESNLVHLYFRNISSDAPPTYQRVDRSLGRWVAGMESMDNESEGMIRIEPVRELINNKNGGGRGGSDRPDNGLGDGGIYVVAV